MLCDRAGRKLRRKHFALLIADRLAVDDEADLRVVAQRVEEAIGIRRHAAGAVHDAWLSPPPGSKAGNLAIWLRSASTCAEGSTSIKSAPTASTVTVVASLPRVSFAFTCTGKELRMAMSWLKAAKPGAVAFR